MREVIKVRPAARGANRITAGRATARKEQAIEAIVWKGEVDDVNEIQAGNEARSNA